MMIETKRLRLRQLSVSDHSSLEFVLGDEKVMEFSDGPMLTDEIGLGLKVIFLKPIALV